MTVTLVMVFVILAALVLGFLCGRIWQIRCDELEGRARLTLPPVARIPRPRDAETSREAFAFRSATSCILDRAQPYPPELRLATPRLTIVSTRAA
jgi:hypothetical protein